MAMVVGPAHQEETHYMATLRAAAIILLVPVLGCAPYDMEVQSQFRPGPNGTFTYKNVADAIYPDEDPQAERDRMVRLEKYLADNGLCPAGYVITSRQAVVRKEGLIGTIKDIHYEGRCA